jgi:EF hand
MKLATFTSVALLLGAGYAFAQGTPNTMSAGRPTAVLDDAHCQSVWMMASPNGDALSQDKAVPYVVNFHMVDTDNDGTISEDEFKAACGKGLIQGSDASTVKDMEGK